jgi:putative DNA primase/helicase
MSGGSARPRWRRDGALMPANPCLEAALDYAARGWPVLPCSPQQKRPLLAADKGADGKAVRGTGGLSKATVDVDQIAAWWRKWPKAMVAVATGADRCFVLDFDPRVDAETGEVFELGALKAALEQQIGGDLPQSLTAITQSGGVHVWLRWPDDGGEPIRNRGNLPEHVDVRGAGGYVIMPPSVMATGAAYRWMKGRGPGEVEIADAPASLVALLRSTGGRSRPQADVAGVAASGETHAGDAAPARGPARGNAHPVGDGDRKEIAQRKYALAALDNACRDVRTAGSGARNAQLNAAAFAVAQFVAAGVLDAGIARASIEAAARDNPGRDDAGQLAATIDSGWSAGLAQSRDMTGIGSFSPAAPGARSRSQANARAPSRNNAAEGEQVSRGFSSAAPHARQSDDAKLPDGRVPDDLTDGESAAIERRGATWLVGAWNALPPVRDPDGHELRRRLAFKIGQRVACGALGPWPATLALAALAEACEGFPVPAGGLPPVLSPDDAPALPKDSIWRAAADGLGRPWFPRRWVEDLRSAALPMTDMGNAERFRDRFGEDFRYTTAKGWLGWDGRRWAVLDQEKDSTPAEVLAAVFRTVRAIQDEARAVDLSGERNWTRGGLDYVWKATKTSVTMFSEALAAHGRASEGAGRLGCIANLAKRWLTVPIEEFDTDLFTINMLNGTLAVERTDDGAAVVRVRRHDRADLITKLAPVAFDPDALPPAAPLFTGLIEWAQPDAAVRRYVRQWMGYSASGHTGAQILHFWYGLGGNGKSAVIDVCHAALGDYADTIGIETFLDQGIKKRGDQATPDLADLSGVRALRASEPERGAKLNAALIKAATGGEPMKVRALHKGFFPLRPRFKLTMAGNHRPEIGDTDEGIWRRVKLVMWGQSITPEMRDDDLVDKIKGDFAGVPGEMDGVFAWLVEGLRDWRAHGFVEPEAVTNATADYRSDSDPLARFLKLCIEQAPGERVQSSRLHAVFSAWAKAAGEREWTQKGLTQAMKAKGFSNKASNGMQWLDVRLARDVHDFIDADGRVIDLTELAGEDRDGSAPTAPPGAAPPDPFAPDPFA